MTWILILIVIGLVGCTKTASGISPGSSLPVGLTITAVKQGVIASDGTAIPVEEFMQSISVSIDASSGLSTGKAKHQPLQITKQIDKTSPQLMQALTTNENLPKVKILFSRPKSDGKMEQYYIVELTNAHAVDIFLHTNNNTQEKAFEDVKFTYETITGTYLLGSSATNASNGTTIETGTAPFHISVNPDKITIAKGQNIPYSILIEADEGFNESVNLTLDLDAPLLGSHYELGKYGPGYPYTLNYTMLLPANIPLGFDIKGTMTASNGVYKTSVPVEVHIEGPVKFIGNSLNWLARIPSMVGSLFDSSPPPAPIGNSYTANWN